MKLGMLTQWFDPEAGPAGLPGVYAREFVRQGHDVQVLTGFPNYPEGELYPGYRMRPRMTEHMDGVAVTRVPLYPNHSRSAMGRFANYASFALSAATLGAGALRGSDAIWVYNSPASVALPQLLHSRFGRTPVFLHIQDLWPDSLIESGMFPGGRFGTAATRLVAAVVRLMENRSAVIGVISPGVRELILSRNPKISPDQIAYVPNPTNEALYGPVSELRKDLQVDKPASSPVEFMYAGSMGDVQGLDTLIDAAQLLNGREDIQITLVGDGIARTRLESRVQALGLRNVTFTGRVPQAEIPHLMARSDAQLVSLAANDFLRYTTPSKIPTILATGTPIVAQIEGDGAALIRDAGAGEVSAPGDATELAEAISKIANLRPEQRAALGETGKHYYQTALSAETAAAKISGALMSPGCS
ncbi:glycosyltransferase family 4 protein [Tessaracoccus defluvii]|uniref:Glycosyltransferase family 4 protein n=1 Tax=Tessaracoccus defluvii TaxID=1285901 RepID=A0A7H0H3D5_9ACTN|nr:glycosyltransferase family 4 protein [Tessaracoccus defluvii]QNP55051.1 glycosyltransferase family 4 protein [Tessaracoccus defluvii]